MAGIKFEIIEEIGVIADTSKGWKKEINLVSWNDNAPKFDIRDWSHDHDKMGKGITLSNEELKVLKVILNEMNI